MQRAFLLIYTFLYFIALLFLLPKEYFKRAANIRKRWIKEKFGFFNNTPLQPSALSLKPIIWIHAVSVGEVISISKLVRRLSEDYDIILSTITDTGQKVAQERFKNQPVRVIYMPFDMPNAINRSLKTLNPSMLILTETELWPNLIKIASKKIPVCLVNGRLSEKSFMGYKKIRFFIKPIIQKMHLICVQEEIYKERFIKIGADKEKLYVTGNMKFDIELKKLDFYWESLIPRPVILAGSTHEPEEEIVLDAYIKLNLDATLIIAPRHPERFEEVENLIKNKIKEYQREIFFSKLSNLPSAPSSLPVACILLVDQMGILGSLYRICDIAIIGGSLIPHGGQNPLEPAYWKKPIICGSYMDNFPFIKDFVDEKACFIVQKETLPDYLRKLIDNPPLRNEMGEKSFKIFQNKSGATERTIKIIKKIIY